MLLSKDVPKGWHVVYTMPRFEKKIHRELLKNGVEAYLPIEIDLIKKTLALCESPEKLYDQCLIGDEVLIVSRHFEGHSGRLPKNSDRSLVHTLHNLADIN